MFGIGIPELILILIVGLIVFGPGKLPEVGRAVGKGLREFRKASSALQAALDEPPSPKETAPPPAAAPVPAQADAAATLEKPDASAPTYEPPTQESVRQQLQEKRDSQG